MSHHCSTCGHHPLTTPDTPADFRRVPSRRSNTEDMEVVDAMDLVSPADAAPPYTEDPDVSTPLSPHAPPLHPRTDHLDLTEPSPAPPLPSPLSTGSRFFITNPDPGMPAVTPGSWGYTHLQRSTSAPTAAPQANGNHRHRTRPPRPPRIDTTFPTPRTPVYPLSADSSAFTTPADSSRRSPNPVGQHARVHSWPPPSAPPLRSAFPIPSPRPPLVSSSTSSTSPEPSAPSVPLPPPPGPFCTVRTRDGKTFRVATYHLSSASPKLHALTGSPSIDLPVTSATFAAFLEFITGRLPQPSALGIVRFANLVSFLRDYDCARELLMARLFTERVPRIWAFVFGAIVDDENICADALHEMERSAEVANGGLPRGWWCRLGDASDLVHRTTPVGPSVGPSVAGSIRTANGTLGVTGINERPAQDPYDPYHIHHRIADERHSPSSDIPAFEVWQVVPGPYMWALMRARDESAQRDRETPGAAQFREWLAVAKLARGIME